MATDSRKRAKVSENPMSQKNESENVQIWVTLEYHGTNYGGWQRQGSNNSILYPSVQGTLEEAATKACQSFAIEYGKHQSGSVNEVATCSATKTAASTNNIWIPTTEKGDCDVVMSVTSGRTDRAVHALDHHCLLRLPFSTALLQSQASHGLTNFLTGLSTTVSSSIDDDPGDDPARVPAATTSPFLKILNDKCLPPDVHVLTCRILTKPQRKNLKFQRKRYHYILQQCPAGLNRPWPGWNDYTYFAKESLDVEKMEQGLQLMVGTHDFLPLSCQKEKGTTIRTLYGAKLTVMEAPFDNLPWFSQANQPNKSIKKKERKKQIAESDLVRDNKQQAKESNEKSFRPLGSIFSPPHFGVDATTFIADSSKHFPRPADCKLICLEFEGSGFLRHQVRRMVSVLLKIGEGVWEPDYVRQLLDGAKPLKQGLALAPGRGLWKAGIDIGEIDKDESVDQSYSDNNEKRGNGER